MDVLGHLRLQEMLHSYRQHAENRKVLATLLKYEIQHLLQELALTGEESVVMTFSVTDGAVSVIGSDCGERFIQNQDMANTLVMDFKEQFLQFCCGADERLTRDDIEDSATENSFCVPEINDFEPTNVNSTLRSQVSPRNKTKDPTDEKVSELVKSIMKVGKEKETRAIKKLNIWTQELAKKSRARLLRKHSLPPIPSYDEPPPNREAEKYIETKVSQLVENIKAEVEMKEQQKILRDTRKRRRSNARLNIPYKYDSNYYDSGPRKKARSIADCFPVIPSYTDRLDSNSNDEMAVQTVIKVEPVTEGYEDDHVDKSKVETSEDDSLDHIVIKNVGTIKEEKFDENLDQFNSVATADTQHTDGNEHNDTVKETTEIGKERSASIDDESTTSTVEVVMENDMEEELELPFVEEYYKHMGDVTLKEEEIEPLEDIDILYQTLRKPNNSTGHSVQHVGKFCRTERKSTKPKNILYKTSSRNPRKYNLVHLGYSYIKDKVGKGNTVYWKCGRVLCKGRVIQKTGENIIQTKEHNHSPTIDVEKLKHQKSTVKSEKA